MHRLVKKSIRLLIPTLVILVLAPFMTQRHGKGLGDRTFTCVMAPEDTSGMGYPIGYGYEMLSTFAVEERIKLDISLWEGSDMSMDTLFAHGTSMLAVPISMADTLGEGYLVTDALANGTVWVMPESERHLGKVAEKWLSDFMATTLHDTLVQRFTPHYDPFLRLRTGRKYQILSPYDTLLREYADSLGWDWRALAALMWQESRFRIEARSSMGATGLMQMSKVTAKSQGVEDALDPRENIAAGANYIRMLQRLFRSRASGEELMQLTLAAYNAGEGRILDCIHYAEAHGLPANTWEDLKAVLPAMRDSVTIVQDSSVRLGVFKGYETERYVAKMDTLARVFRSISTEP